MTSQAIESEAHADEFEKVRRTELLISNLLRAGVLASVALVVLGTIITFIHHPGYLTSSDEMDALRDARNGFPTTVPAVVSGLADFDGRAFVMAGLLLLIATPIMRVAVSVFAFIQLGDRTFTVVTTAVLTLLILALILGKAGG
ncbi:MAG: DUF1634 domain-containing protein [Dehalococcoidia bacterium]|nr:DUF1634 domain-containing protein [Dehalococcoidia bacterium]